MNTEKLDFSMTAEHSMILLLWEHLGCLKFFAILNKTAMDTFICFWNVSKSLIESALTSFRRIPKRRTELKGKTLYGSSQILQTDKGPYYFTLFNSMDQDFSRQIWEGIGFRAEGKVLKVYKLFDRSQEITLEIYLYPNYGKP